MAFGRPLRFMLFLLLLVLSLGGLWVVFTTPGLRPAVISVYEPPIIQPDEAVHDLGNIITDSQAIHTFYLSNVGGKRLLIQKVDTSCGCTVADVSKKSVAPGEVTALKVTLDTSIKLGKVKKKITVYSNDPKQPVLNLYLKAMVLPQTQGHEKIVVKDPLVLFKGKCATCHVMKGKGKTGKGLFQADCAMCHGMNAQGAVAPGLNHENYDDPKTLERLRRVISQGSPRTPEMPPFAKSHGGPLSEGEIDSLLNYLQFQAQLAKTGKSAPVASEEEE